MVREDDGPLTSPSSARRLSGSRSECAREGVRGRITQQPGNLRHRKALILQVLNFVISFALISVLFGAIYKVLPDAELSWRDVLIGAMVTALLFSLGKFLIGLYLAHSAVASSYGAAGALIVVLLWIYYSAQIFLLGAEFTKIHASRRGTPAAIHATSK